jgi:peptide deformylase
MHKMIVSANGVGLAAPQINEPFQIAIISPNQNKMDAIEIINPRITAFHDPIPFVEGCLSVPGEHVHSVRYTTITLEFDDRFGKSHKKHLEGLEAIIAQHECDHLKGKLITQFLTPIQQHLLELRLLKSSVKSS